MSGNVVDICDWLDDLRLMMKIDCAIGVMGLWFLLSIYPGQETLFQS